MTPRRAFVQMSTLAMLAPSLAHAEPSAAGPISESFVFPEWRTALEQAVAGGANRGDRAFAAVLRGFHPAYPAAGVLTLAAPGVEPFAPDRAAGLAALANDRLAELMRASRGRLRGFATIAASDPHGVREAERAVALGFCGISLGCNRGWRLDHAGLRPVLEFAAGARLKVYLPASYAPFASDIPYRANGAAGIIAGAASDSARHATQLMFGGVLDAVPGLQVVLARLGQATPFWYGTFNDMHASLQGAGNTAPRRAPAGYFGRSIHLTTADMDAHTLRYCDQVLGAGRVLRAASYT